MGYKRKRTVYELTFPEFEGLVVRAKSLSLGELMQIMRSADVVSAQEDRTTAEALQAIEDMLARFSKALLSWNLEDEDGTPVPATREALEGEDLDFVMRIIEAWSDAVAGVPEELGKDSSSGQPFPEVSIPMAAL